MGVFNSEGSIPWILGIENHKNFTAVRTFVVVTSIDLYIEKDFPTQLKKIRIH